MRVVVDMNVLVSATIKPSGRLGRILAHLRNGDFELLYFPKFLREYAEVCSRPHLWHKYNLNEEEIFATIQVMTSHGMAVDIVTHVDACRDPDDNIILALAVDGKANYIVSGDMDLLTLTPFQGIPIITPAAFLPMLEDSE